ncbi:hypothetical protein [Paenibacillus taichungensis]|uniref:hypothetical protein n=1 Tax=Paenibacillus taichungensis TaxID=484184 RepID=UPI002871A4B8|nr:hypothetical protein [Paenibacillus taichungensis]MDR9744112.1 hypothetical protein [Paenibacillus taichungensis]
MPVLDAFTLDNYRLDGPSRDLTTRTTIVANLAVPTMLANSTGLTISSQYIIPTINKFLDIYSPDPYKSISKSGVFLIDVAVRATSQMYFSSSQYLEASLVLTDDKYENFKFLTSRRIGSNQSGLYPDSYLSLFSLSIDKENRKLYYAGFTSQVGSSTQTGVVDIPSSFNLDGIIYLEVGAEKNYTTDGGNHTMTIERRALTVLTS